MIAFAVIGAVLGIAGASLVAYGPVMAQRQRTTLAGRDTVDASVYWANVLWFFGNLAWGIYGLAAREYPLAIQAVVMGALAARGVCAWR